MKIFNSISACLLFVSALSHAQSGSIKGLVKTQDSAGTFASVRISELQRATATDGTGHFILKDLPEGQYTLRTSSIGYKPNSLTVRVKNGDTSTVLITLKPSFSSLNDVVITGTRTSRRRLESPVAVNVLDSRTFNLTQSNTVSEGLCFQPGLRMETDCQTCNYTQLRMNGLGGSYSQILINSRPVFTSLMSLYGLDQIPANMIDRIEIVRGGGSVLYGSSAIAGTVNILTKEPQSSSFTLSSNQATTKGKAADNFYNVNANVINESKNAGTSFFASHRSRQAYDANGDGYSEISRLTNNSFGFNSFLKLNRQNRLEVNGWSIYEERRGGNKIEEQADKADQSEYRLHNILLGGINYDHFSKDGNSSLSIYLAGQHTKRTHYTGIDHADAWGRTKNHSLQAGLQYNYTFSNFLGGKNTVTTGLEMQHEYTYDQISFYNYLIDQTVNLGGAFIQSDWEIGRHLTVLSGLRVNKSNKVSPAILTPRLSALYKLGSDVQLRGSYARGFKAPQAFEADMHIAFAGGGVSIIRIDPNLKEETSDSFNASIDFNRANELLIYGFTIDAFHTRLHNSFILEETGADDSGNQQLLRKNGKGSSVKGITVEQRLNYNQKFQLESGVTFQRSTFEQGVAWSSELPPSRKYLRTPDVYGYYTFTMFPRSRFNASISGVVTGSMKVPHFAGAPGINEDVLFTSPTFNETNLKLSYRFTIKSIAQDLQIYAGVQNIFDSYQGDFDTGKNRDSNYIYGPSRPFTMYAGIKFGLM
ncbi:TonB-dependent receptor domain-containing protein [Arcticibacter sp. MXS-1]|uniref:TonB-dependent receptor n=1 Tax=Arcticibacter sp. MXS-1 TaxID=3341726 RepID=UPI0035A8DBA4